MNNVLGNIIKNNKYKQTNDNPIYTNNANAEANEIETKEKTKENIETKTKETNEIENKEKIKENDEDTLTEIKRIIRKSKITLDNKILQEMLDNQLLDINAEFGIYKYNGDMITEFKNDVQEIHAIIYNPLDARPVGFLRTINPNYFYNTESTFKPTYINYLETIAGNRNIYESNTFRGIANYNLYNAYDYEFNNDFDKKSPRKFKCGDLIRTPLYTYDINNRYMTYKGLFKNSLTFAKVFDYFTSNETEYIINECKKTKYKNICSCSHKYDIVKIPKDIMKMFKQITYYYEEALKIMELDEKTGHYCYIYNNVKIPVICKHQIMLLQGVSNMDIAIECYKDGICKYCKQEIAGYNVDTLTLPNNAMSVIIQFCECFKDPTIMDILIKDIGDFIVKKLNHMGISVYNDEECNGFTYLFITKLALVSLKEFNVYPTKIKELINKIAKLLAFLGKSDQDVKEIIEDNNLIDISSLIEQIKTDINESFDETKTHNFIIEDVLFNSSTDRTPRTPIQKLYLTEPKKIYELYLLFKNEYNKLYNFHLNEKFKYDRKLETEEIIIKTKLNNSGFKFFMNNYNNYCPINNIHEYKDKKCIHCGIDKDGKNKEDIYKKYSEIINTVSTNELSTNVVIKKTEKDTAKIIEEINKTQDDTFKNMLKTFNLDFTQITDIERLLEKTNEDYIKTINEILNIDYKQLKEFIEKEPQKNQKKLILYIINKGFTNIENAINILMSNFALYNPLDFIVSGHETTNIITEDIAPEA